MIYIKIEFPNLYCLYTCGRYLLLFANVTVVVINWNIVECLYS